MLKYRFDFARLVNQSASATAYLYTAFHFLCFPGNTDHNIACIKNLFSICENIPKCSINILARDYKAMCGLHYAIGDKDVNLTKYLLENVYFANNDKLNKDGVAFMNMQPMGSVSLATFVMHSFTIREDGNVKRDLEMFKLLASHGMKLNPHNGMDFMSAIISGYAELVAFILNQNLYRIDTLEKVIEFMRTVNGKSSGSVNTDILKALYNYGFEHRLIWNKFHHLLIIKEASICNLATFKATMSMILEKHGIKDLKQYKQCDITDEMTLKMIMQSSDTLLEVKSFLKALMCDDEKKLLATSNGVILTCINNHEINNNNDNKIDNYGENCSVCGDSGDGLQSLSGFQCDECKSFICQDCVIIQKISKKINDNGNNLSVLYAAGSEILEYKHNQKMLNKVELLKFSLTLLYFLL